MKMRTSALVVVLSMAVASGTLLLSDGIPGRAAPVDHAHLLGQVMERVGRSYIDTTTESQLYSHATIGLLRRLGDPHATYIPASRLSSARLALLRERVSSAAAGPGIDIDERDGWIVVISPHPGSSAERAGVRAGDRIVQVNGVLSNGLSAEEVRLELQGSPASKVNVTLERRGVAHPMAFELTRQVAPNKPVRAAFMLSPVVGYVKLDKISAATGEALSAAVVGLTQGKLETLIVDLRGNPGGLPEDGVAVADLFLPSGAAIASTRGRKAPDAQSFEDHNTSKWSSDSLELILLVDGGTANGSEIVAGALQDMDRALVVGRSTYGKASRQELISLSNGDAVMITTSRWYTPLGRSIEPAEEPSRPRTSRADTVRREEFKTKSGRIVIGGGGITPNVIVRATAEQSSALPSDFYQAGNAKLLLERDAAIRVAVSLASQAQGQAELLSRAQAAEALADDEPGR